jgi:hypothetical protein
LLGNFTMKQNLVNVGSYSVFGYKLSLLLASFLIVSCQ